ncbi:Serine/threonine-protein phosphatase 2B catalytic subunit [Galdieria sulphuraria]|nr:Serine/threonine-protein phosphatase 2B catalytic subunit [Galdieria sulphuraria]
MLCQFHFTLSNWIIHWTSRAKPVFGIAFGFALQLCFYKDMWKRFLANVQPRKNSLPVQGSFEEDEAKMEQNRDSRRKHTAEAFAEPLETREGLETFTKVHYSVSVPDLRRFQDNSSLRVLEDQSDGSEQDRFSEILGRISDTEEAFEAVEHDWINHVANHEQEFIRENDLFFWEDSEELAAEVSDCAIDDGKVGLEGSYTELTPKLEISTKTSQVTKEEGDARESSAQPFVCRILPAGTIPYISSSNIDGEYIRIVLRRFQELGWRDDVSLTKTVISTVDAKKIIKDTISVVAAESNVLDVRVPEGGVVHIIGDIHGHLYDLSSILENTGYPNCKNTLLFNGDYVDRGSWGIEVLLILCLLKLWEPRRVFLLRGNHETSYCNVIYGFRKECIQKYNVKVYLSCQQLFCHLPVAAVVSNHISYIVDRDSPERHSERDGMNASERAGSLWKGWWKNSTIPVVSTPKSRKKFAILKTPLGSSVDIGHYLHKSTVASKIVQQDVICGSVPDTSPNNSRAGSDESFTQPQKISYRFLTPLEDNERRVLVLHGGLFRNSSGKLGTLKELVQIPRNLPDPTGTLEDILWSDPDYIYGFGPNRMRGAGIAFGPDMTKQFLRDNNLSYIIRSHEGPDAREKRKDFPSLRQGHSIDFVTIGRRKKEIFSESIQKGASSSDCDSIETLPLLITVFSAPAYPEGPNARNNLGAICTLDESMEPSFETFHANQRPCKAQTTAMLVEDAVKDLRAAALERSSFGRVILKLSGRNY